MLFRMEEIFKIQFSITWCTENNVEKKLKAVIMELNGSGGRYGFDENKILNLMCDYGFKRYTYDPFNRKLTELNDKKVKLDNVLFIRDKKYVQNKINNAPCFIINDKQI